MNIFLTLDYELFLGENSGTVNNCLITPMKLLIDRTRDSGVKFTIFVDAAYIYQLYRLKESNSRLENDYYLIIEHIKELAEEGHDIQLHMHPQWFFSSYVNNKWEIDKGHYKLSDLSKIELDTLFCESKRLLEEIVGKPVIAFRAGGYSIQTLDNYSKFLIDNNIIIDSSVASGQKCMTDCQYYDYQEVSGDLYKFSNDICRENKDGLILELPITSFNQTMFSYYLYRLYLILFKISGSPFGDGVPAGSTKKVIKYKNLFKHNYQNCSMDFVFASLLGRAFKEAKNNNIKNFVAIGHPKSMSPQSINYVGDFINENINSAKFLTVSDLV